MVVWILTMLSARLSLRDSDSEALKSLTEIAMFLALAKQNSWATGYSDQILERSEESSHRLGYAVFAALQYVAPNMMETDRSAWSDRAVAWLSRALHAAARGVNTVRKSAGDTWDEPTAERLKRLYGVPQEIVMRLHFAFDPQFSSSRRGGEEPTEKQRLRFYEQVKPLLQEILLLAREPVSGTMFASTAHHFMEFLQQAHLYDPRGVLHLAAEVVSAAEGGGYHLDSMAASETVKLAERILTDHRSELRDPSAISDLVQLLDVFAKVGWPDALALLWRLDEIFR